MAAVSQVTVVNGGLRILGVPRIASFSEDSPAAKLANEHFGNIRDQVLRAHPWSCATKRAELAAISGPPLFGYDHRYALPADYLRVVPVKSKSGTDPHGNTLNEGAIWEIESGELLTDRGTPLRMRYIWRNEDPTTWDANFVGALEARIAEEFGEALTGTNTLVEKANAIYSRNLTEARTMNGQESSPDRTEASEWIRARF